MKKILFSIVLFYCNQIYTAQPGSKQLSHTQSKRKHICACACIPKSGITVLNVRSPLANKPGETMYLLLTESGNQLTARIELATPNKIFNEYVKVVPELKKMFYAAKQAVLSRIKKTPNEHALRTFSIYDDKSMEEVLIAIKVKKC